MEIFIKKDFLLKNNLKFDPKLFGAQDLFFTKTAIVLADSVATVPGAVYNVVDTETALGKSKTKLKQRNSSEDILKAQKNLHDLLIKHNALELMNTPELPFVIEELKIFNLCITRKHIFPNKIRYYLFGINIGTRHILKK